MTFEAVLEALRVAVMIALVFVIAWCGRTLAKEDRAGLRLILIGFVLLFCASAIDLLDDYELTRSLFPFAQASITVVLEKGIGYLGGFVFLAVGFFLWLPKVHSLTQEISRRRDAEATLRQNEATLTRAQRQAKIGSWRWDLAADELISCSAEYARIHGVGTDEAKAALAARLDHVIHADDRDRLRALYERVGKEGTDYVVEYRIVRSDGELRHLLENGEVVRDQSGRVIEWTGTLQDVSEQKWGEAELRESEERLRQAMQLAKIGHCIWDSKEDRCVFCSDEYARVHGLTPDEYIARATTPEGSLNHPDDRDAYRAAIHDLRRGKAFAMEYRVVTPDGEIRHVREVAKPVFDNTGTVVQEICTIQDITEAKQSEERLRQAQKIEAVGQLTGGVAHDFNNLLAVIHGNAELLADSAEADAPLVRSILHASARGAELTQRLLAFSRQQPLRPRAIELADLVAGMSGLLERTLGETIAVETKVQAGLWTASADPGQVENAILNLAINARDAMQSGGKLTIECANARLDGAYAVQNPEAVPGDYVLLKVRDTGTGMPPEARARVFEPFFTTKEVGQGSGLGLSMVYGFAKQSDGHITIESEEGRGTAVKLYLPRTETVPASANAGKSDEVPLGRGEVVLVVEDDPDVRELAVAMLESLGYRVVAVPEAASGRAVLEREANIDLLLSDVVLPGGTSGPEFVEAARQIYPDLKVIFMSGYTAEADNPDGILGSDRVLLNKPFRRNQLAKVLRAALD